MTQRIGRYELIRPIASGGMATVHLGRVVGAGGFQRLVAIKLMHPHIASDPEFVGMFLDEARLAAGIRHPNVVATLDIEQSDGGLGLVMEYVEGSAAHMLIKALRSEQQRLPLPVALRIVLDALAGLHAAHELRGPDGRPLGLVHRDVSPQNVLIGIDGVSRITDFGVARAEARISSTRGSQVKGKVPYMSPEQLRAEEIDRRSDVYAIGVVLWELLTGQRLFKAPSDGALVASVMSGPRASPAQVDPAIPPALDAVCMRALAATNARFATAAEFADALEDAATQAGIHPASPRAVGRFVEQTLRRHNLLITPEEMGGAGSVSLDYRSSPAASGAPPVAPVQKPITGNSGVLQPASFEDDQAPTIARDVSSGVNSLLHAIPPASGTGASAVGPVATPTAAPRRTTAIGVGAAVGGGLFLLVLVSILVWTVALRGPNTSTQAAAASAPAPAVTIEPTAAADPTPPTEPAPSESATPAPSAAPPVSAAPAETAKPVTKVAKPSWTAPAPAPKPKPKPKSGGEFQPDRL